MQYPDRHRHPNRLLSGITVEIGDPDIFGLWIEWGQHLFGPGLIGAEGVAEAEPVYIPFGHAGQAGPDWSSEGRTSERGNGVCPSFK